MPPRLALAVALSVLVLAACSGSEPDAPPLVSTPLAPATPTDSGAPMFRQLDPAESGLMFVNRLMPLNVMPYVYNGAGVCIGDYDGDGLPDVYLVSQDGPNKLFRQTAPLRFQDVTESAGGLGGGEAWGTGATFADVDGDGDLDLYVCNTEAPNLCFVNRGDGTFVERAKALGLAHVGASTSPAFADYDNDGDLDLYLLTNRVLHPTLPPPLLAGVKPPADTKKTLAEMSPPPPTVHRADGVPVIPAGYVDFYTVVQNEVYPGGQADRLLRNDGGRFTDVTAASGIRDHGMGLSATWWDFDDDGWLDMYVANDLESPDVLYRNLGDGTFRDVTAERLPHLAYFGMGSDHGDVDNDGRLDLIVADMSSTTHYRGKMLMGNMGNRGWFLANARPPQYMRNQLFLNTGTERFMEIGFLAGVASTDWTWAVKFGDLDNDGWVDLFATNGIPRFDNDPDANPRFREMLRAGQVEQAIRFAQTLPPIPEQNLAFRNDGHLHFEDVSDAWGFKDRSVSHGAAWADLDRDGDLDLIVNNMNAPASVYENRSNSGARVLLRLVGTQSNSWGIGAKVELESGGMTQVRLNTLARGYLSADEPLVHFGLGEASAIDRLTVSWPSGVVQELGAVPAGSFHTITEPRHAPRARRFEPPPVTRFVEIGPGEGLDFVHEERPFDDFAVQGLLPHRHSQLGPGVALGDADGDGRDDVFVGGAAGQPGRLLVRRGDGRFTVVDGPWRADAECEDQGALWLDADGDGDQDLLVVSGGVEAGERGELLGDRLYRNDGAAGFRRADASVLPPGTDSGSCAIAADFDRDGDLDVFVGARLVPGRYPHVPQSRLLRNDGGRFVDATDSIAADLRRVGLVYGAVWTDHDGDGFVDLLVASHWSSLRLFKNHGGTRLVDATAAAGLLEHTGLWNAVASGDLDGDGDLDLVATNLGWNTKYKASVAKPMQIFVSDFDENGVLDVVEAKFEGETLLPVRGKSCSTAAMPFLADKFKTFDAFARASLEEIYTPAALASARRYAVTTLANAVFENRGDGRFLLRELPRFAQASAGFGVALVDFDGDGRLDVYLAQNFFGPEPETGRVDGGLSVLLRNRGGLEFAPIATRESGLLVAGDAKALASGDLDGDRQPDFCVSINDAPLRAFVHRTASPARALAVRLVGAPGNPTAVGARVVLRAEGLPPQVREVQAGAGYLSQSSAVQYFALGEEVAGARIEVRWPDGETTQHEVEGAGEMRIAR